ncbi:MAG: class I SAM-dependent methyltransferase [Pseudomonadota bacterium]
MFDEFDYSFTRYLSAKKSVDDRALNRCVWDKFQETFATFGRSKSLNILEIGSGIGTMFERSIQCGIVNAARYTALDAMPENILEAKIRLPLWAKRLGYSVHNISENELRFHGSGIDTTVDLRRGDFFEFAEKSKGLEKWNVIMANAFLDLVDVGKTLPIMLNLLKPDGLLFFTINFDGVTIFEPTIDRDLDSLIERLYHQTMDERIIDDNVSGDSKTGRHLFEHARNNGLEIMEAGSSDWTVFARKNGYRGDEAYFLHFIIHTMYIALKNRPEIDQDEFRNWILKRHSQVEQLKLVFMAHQIDLLCRK